MRKILQITLFFLVAFGAWLPLSRMSAEHLIVEKPMERADVILVLAGSSAYDERAVRAAEIYKQGVAPLVLLTDDGESAGWSRAEQRNPPFVELARKTLVAQGVPPENIEILEPQTSGTIYEARLLRQIAQEKKYKTILLVTSAYHTRRALHTFEKVFAENDVDMEIGIESARTGGEQTPTPFSWWLNGRGWQMVAGEYVKGLYYWIYY